jgi:hypothetical protein
MPCHAMPMRPWGHPSVAQMIFAGNRAQGGPIRIRPSFGFNGGEWQLQWRRRFFRSNALMRLMKSTVWHLGPVRVGWSDVNNTSAGSARRRAGSLVLKIIRLPALMDLYIHPPYVIVSKILSSILNSPALIHLYIILYPLYPLWDLLVTLSKYNGLKDLLRRI